MDVPMMKCPGFFKFYMPQSNSEELNIPSGFVQDIKEAWPENVTLRDRYDNLWQVKVEKVGDIWYFKDGWKKFVAENFLDWGDVVTFKYLDGVFYVKTFGRNACEKKRPPNACEKKKSPNACENNGAVSPKDTNTEEEDKDDKVATKEDSNEYDTKDDNFVVLSQDVNEQDEDDQGEPVMDENEHKDDPGEQVADAGAATTRTRRGRKRITDWFDGELFRSGLARQPRNPYFVTRNKPCRQDEFHVPKAVVNLYKLELPESIVLVDESRREFPTDRKIWTDGRTFYTGGWRNFCALNLVNLDDKCICEFIRGKGGHLYIRISVIRANGQQD